MNKFIRWYNENRTAVIVIVIAITLIILVIHTLNAILEKKQEEKRNNIARGNSSTNTSTTISDTGKSAITGKEVPKSINQDNTEVIKEFIKYCNDGKMIEAYNMLSDECKENVYPSLESFTNNYYKQIFYMNRMYDIQNLYMSGNLYTYNIKYTEDVLATGNVKSSDNRSDYITVVQKNDKSYLNISGYIGRKIVNKNTITEGIELTVNYIDMYMDYTTANISVINNIGKTICLDTKEKTSTAYLYDTNNVKYDAFLNEISEQQLEIRDKYKTNISIKYNKIYNPERTLIGIVFSDIVTNYDNYVNNKVKKEVIKIDINI